MFYKPTYLIFQHLIKVVVVLLALAHFGVSAQVCAAPGKDGPGSLSGTINTYYEPTPSNTYGPSASSFSLINPRGAGTAIGPSDLVLVIQMQCESITTSNDADYGANDGTGRGYADLSGSCRAGQYEYVRAGPATSNTNLDLTTSPLVNTYVLDDATAANRRTFQIVRVPQFSSVSLTGQVDTVFWNGATGGIIAMDVAGNLDFNNSTIDVSGAGFRGGGGALWNNTAPGAADYVVATNIVNNLHGFKGEGIAGTPRYVYDPVAVTVLDLGATWGGYTSGDQARGAPGNAAGGGDNFNGGRDNGGGGGGGNGGIGGYGGYGWRGGGWVGVTYAVDARDLRGIGGGAFNQAAFNRLVMGGGGGAGGNNNGTVITSSGGSGGGIVLIRTGSASGVGTIKANGFVGNTRVANDAGGGAGAAGSVAIISANGTLGALTVNAVGGRGGDSFVAGTVAHGGGGGGAGGVVYTSGVATIDIAGGANGLTNAEDSPPDGVSHGATSGASGVAATSIGGTPTGVLNGAVCLPVLTVKKSTSTPAIVLPGGTTAGYVISVSNSTAAGVAYGVAVNDLLPVPFGLSAVLSTANVVLSGATGPAPMVANQSGNTTTAVFGVAGSANSPTIDSYTLVPGGAATFTFVVNVNNGALVTYQNSAGTTFTDPTRTTGGPALGSAIINPVVTPGGAFASGGTVGGSNYLSSSSTAEDVSLRATTTLSVTKTDDVTSVAAGSSTSYTLTFSNIGGYAADNAMVRDIVGAGLSCTTVTCNAVSGGAVCPTGLVLNIPSTSASMPNFFNATGVPISSFPANSSLSIKVTCEVTATGQ